ncbi:MAG TPA: helix-turn-helix domain-containing protein [Anaerolineae bacterium]|nr:helix-turn-helix domain-containing protein [Anaerolineae bacterium]
MYTREAMAIRSKIIGVLLRNARIKAGKSRKDCAAVLGCSPDTISRFEYGRKDITLPQLEVLAYFFGLPITYFWDKDAISEEEEEMERPVAEIMTIRRKIIGVLLRQARLDAGKSQKQCAKALSCSAERVSQYERGQKDIPLPELEALADFLDVPITHFLDEQTAPLSREAPKGNGAAVSRGVETPAELPPDVRDFISNPTNVLYIRIAMKLSTLSVDALRQIAETLLDITF